MLEKILDSSYRVVSNAKYVRVNDNKIKELVSNNSFNNNHHWLDASPFGLLDESLENIVNFLIIYDSIDFSFWGNPKWTIKTLDGDLDGAFALMYSLLKLRKEKGHLNFLEISFLEFKNALKGNVEIPLLDKRYDIVKNISEIINTKLGGNFYNYIKDINKDEELFQVIIDNFPSFRDVSVYNGEEVYFYKLAQLVTSDILAIKKLKTGEKGDLNHLVGVADYKIPQILRELGILEYNLELSKIVDEKIEIKEGSLMEIEIRASMLVSIDKIYNYLNKSVDRIVINDILWSLGQNKSKNRKPYHLTRTTHY